MGFLKFFYPLLTRFQCTPVFLNYSYSSYHRGAEVPVSVRLCLFPFGVVKFVGEKKKIYNARELEKAGKRPDLKRVQRKMKCTGTGLWLILALKGCKAGYSLFFWLKLTPLFNCRFLYDYKFVSSPPKLKVKELVSRIGSKITSPRF